jgi:hypothetical protein
VGALAAYAKAKHYGMGVIVREGSQAIEFLLPSSIPQAQLNMSVVDEYICTREILTGFVSQVTGSVEALHTVDVILYSKPLAETRPSGEMWSYQRLWAH